MLATILTGLTPDERWDAQHSARRSGARRQRLGRSAGGDRRAADRHDGADVVDRLPACKPVLMAQAEADPQTPSENQRAPGQ